MAQTLRFFAPGLRQLALPAWDCLPYDRVSPKPEVSARRMATLVTLASLAPEQTAAPLILLTTISAILQKVPPREMVSGGAFRAAPGDDIDIDLLQEFLQRNGYSRVGTVMEPGEYAQRGGIIDIFPPGLDPSGGENSRAEVESEAGPEALRLDLFGDTLDTVRSFDPLTQRTTGNRGEVVLLPVSEFRLDSETVERFRSGYVAAFGAVLDDDPLYEAVSAGHKHQGMEHWLPLFHEHLETLFDYLPDATLCLDDLSEEAVTNRLEMIADYFATRHSLSKGKSGENYKALPPDRLYLNEDDWRDAIAARRVRAISPFTVPPAPETADMAGRKGRDFALERAQPDLNPFDALRDHIADQVIGQRRVSVACYSVGARERLSGVMADHGIDKLADITCMDDLNQLPPGIVGMAVLGIEHGFECDDLCLIGEQDILGDRLVRKSRSSRKAENYIAESSSLSVDDLVVHVDHGIGRFVGLETITVTGSPHDCVALEYHGGDKLYVPVENIEILSRYGSDDSDAALDRLGGAAWQARKAKLKNRIREMAAALIKIAAERVLQRGEVIAPPEGSYEEFAARFPYDETEDQDRAISEVLGDLSSGKPMDRLVCGDVGFGKTEVALRAAFVVAMTGKQVAVVCPTTLLARQHYRTFSERFAGLPIRIGQLSRLVSGKDASATRAGLADGQVDIIIGTHALLGKLVKFQDLGLLIVDEEQHFGVGHKEKLKQLRSNVHILTLTATPIPRTLQLALAGVRDLSLIATPPVDRLATRTFVMPFDGLVVREALMREHFRGGQSFYVAPRIRDLAEVSEFLAEQLPELKVAVAHGQMPTTELEDIMTAFYDGHYDVLLATTIIESGLDIPSVNTLIVHRSDMYGLAQLYQIRGRVGRSKMRAYAYLTIPANKRLTRNAEKRLRVLQAMDSLGTGFSLASHDMDIRGAGNLLGDEQSGHIKEVGFELYQHMLEEAVASARSGDLAVIADPSGRENGAGGQWSPQINLGTSVLISDSYIDDLDLRLEFYRRIANIANEEERESIAAEMIDRFGPLPTGVDHLLAIVTLKIACHAAGIEKLDAGPKGANITFRNNEFANLEGLVKFMTKYHGVKLRPDHRLVYIRDWADEKDRIAGAQRLASDLGKIAAAAIPTATEG